MQVAQTIKEQLVALTPMTVLMSWVSKSLPPPYTGICRHSALR